MEFSAADLKLQAKYDKMMAKKGKKELENAKDKAKFFQDLAEQALNELAKNPFFKTSVWAEEMDKLDKVPAYNDLLWKVAKDLNNLAGSRFEASKGLIGEILVDLTLACWTVHEAKAEDLMKDEIDKRIKEGRKKPEAGPAW